MTSALRIDTLPGWMRGYLFFELPDDMDRQPRRMLIANRSGSLLAAGFALLHMAGFALYDFSGLLFPLLVQALTCLAMLTVPLWRRLHPEAGIWWFSAAGFVCQFLTAWMLSRDCGAQLYLFLAPAGGLAVYGVHRLHRVLLLCVATWATIAFCQIAFTEPAPFVRIDAAALNVLWSISVAGTMVIIFMVLWISMAQAHDAETALEHEHARSERLLGNILPNSIAARLKNEPDIVIADEHLNVSILFADIVDFTPRAAEMPPADVVRFLNRMFSAFDSLTERRGLEKIKTIGDAYMVASGLPEPRGDHAEAMADMALDMIRATEETARQAGQEIQVRIGFHTGQAVGGVIGTRRFFYDVWGDTVNMAARLENRAEPGRIHVADETKRLLEDRFTFAERGIVALKGKGTVKTWWLTGRIADPA